MWLFAVLVMLHGMGVTWPAIWLPALLKWMRTLPWAASGAPLLLELGSAVGVATLAGASPGMLSVLPPQHVTAPVDRRAHTLVSLTVIEVAFVMLETVTGTLLSVDVPLPSEPLTSPLKFGWDQ